MQLKKLAKKKGQLIKNLNELVQTMIVGSLYEVTVNCKIASCKLCEGGKRGHKSNRLGYCDSKKKQKIIYISTKEVSKIKHEHKKFKEAKKLLTDLGEINLLIMKEK
jgi:hypothetical protein